MTTIPNFPAIPLLSLPRAVNIIFLRFYRYAPYDNVHNAFHALLDQHGVSAREATCVLSPNAPYCRTATGVQPESTCTITIRVSDSLTQAERTQLKLGMQAAMQAWEIRDPEHPSFMAERLDTDTE